jgi:hypothetical protein
MPSISMPEAAEKLAECVEKAKPDYLTEFFAELFPEEPLPTNLVASELAGHIRSELLPEEIIERARAIVAHASPLPRTNAAERLLRDEQNDGVRNRHQVFRDSIAVQ